MTTNAADGIAGAPRREGLYDPSYEHDGCGIGFVAHIKGERSAEIVQSALELLENLAHRSAVAADDETGDGAGMLVQIPHAFLCRRCRDIGISLPGTGEAPAAPVYIDGEKRMTLPFSGQIAAISSLRGLSPPGAACYGAKPGLRGPLCPTPWSF